MKKLFFILGLLIVLPAMADEVNMTPQSSFSGYNNKSNIKPMYPRLNSVSDPRAEYMKKKSIHDMGDINPSNKTNAPMTYNQFPKNYDSSNMMLQQGIQNGMQNMFMGM